MVRPGQFTLRALFIATAFVAAACVYARFVAAMRVPLGEFENKLSAVRQLEGLLLLMPILICGTIGAIWGRGRWWLVLGVVNYLLLVTLALVLF